MTDYVGYTPPEYAPDAPATALHFQRWFENWIAGFEGAPGAPKLQPAALGIWMADFAINTTYAGISGLSVRVKKILFEVGANMLNTSVTTNGSVTLQMRVSTDNGATWGSNVNIGNSRSLGQGANSYDDQELAAGSILVDRETGAWRSTILGGGSGTVTAAFNAIQFRMLVNSGAVAPTGHVLVSGLAGVAP